MCYRCAPNYDFGVIIYVPFPSASAAATSRDARSQYPHKPGPLKLHLATLLAHPTPRPRRAHRMITARQTALARAVTALRYRFRNLHRRLSAPKLSTAAPPRQKRRGGGDRTRSMRGAGEGDETGGRLLKDERSSGLLAPEEQMATRRT